MPHMIRRAETRKKAHSSLRYSEKEILEPQREVECAALRSGGSEGVEFWSPFMRPVAPLFASTDDGLPGIPSDHSFRG
jgi:hypothetical protein